MKASLLARMESHLRVLLTKLPPSLAVRLYSIGRQHFMRRFPYELPVRSYTPPDEFSRELWGIKFRSPLMNAAGMFKNGEGYALTALQGAGAYLGGTTTWNQRVGNKKYGVLLPFVPYPRSGASSNFLGLPNDGDPVNARLVAGLERINGCPVGWSLMASPDLSPDDQLVFLVQGMKLYENAGVNFLQINESCPNTGEGKLQDEGLENRLNYVNEHFLKQRSRRLPVAVKLSTDTHIDKLYYILDLLFQYNFDGIIVGNTSTAYAERRLSIHPSERRLYDYFSTSFGCRISGRPLKESSLELAARATEYVRNGSPTQEFHVIRTGGVESAEDILDSERAGISLNEWFTGYFECFSRSGHGLYQTLLADLSKLS